MGDRSNVVIIHETRQINVLTNRGKIPAGTFDLGVGIYTHWCGKQLPLMVQSALKKAKSRWNDPTYCTRIIFDDLLSQSNEHDSGLGWGLYPYSGEVRGEESYQTIYVDLSENTVKIGRRKWSLQSFVNEEVHTFTSLQPIEF